MFYSDHGSKKAAIKLLPLLYHSISRMAGNPLWF